MDRVSSRAAPPSCSIMAAHCWLESISVARIDHAKRSCTQWRNGYVDSRSGLQAGGWRPCWWRAPGPPGPAIMDRSREASMKEQPMWLSATIPLGARKSRFCTGGPCVTRLGPVQEVAVALQPTAVVEVCALKEWRTQLLAAEPKRGSPGCVGMLSSATARPERKPLVRGCPGQSVRSSTTPKTKG